MKASLPACRGRRRRGIEIYSSGRYFTITGDHLYPTPNTIENRHAEILDLVAALDRKSHRRPELCRMPASVARTDEEAIDDLPVQTAGTAFQRGVWNELRRIPSGSAISYGNLAEQIARPKAVRAVGLANGPNPIGIVVPCHRVIGANRSLTSYGWSGTLSGGCWSTNGSTAKGESGGRFRDA